jgi:hypothetical protein
MTTLEALVSISQTVLRARGEWTVEGENCTVTAVTLRNDIARTVPDCAKLLRIEGDMVKRLSDMATAELMRRARLVA